MPRTLLCVTVVAVALAGCTTKPRTDLPGGDTATSQADPWPTAATTLRKQPDLGGARQVVSQLTADLANNPKAEAPAALPPDAVKQLADLLRLTPGETKEISGGTYTTLDAAYLGECLLLRDAVRSLDLGNHSPERKAQLAFAWVCRQVYLRQGVIRVGNGLTYSPPLPPQYALLRGYGTGLDRAYVFLAALQQLGFDGCLIGPPGREQAPSIAIENDKPTKGPFWAVGARTADGQVLLFDPWRGQPFPGPNGGVGTLAEVLANPDQMKPWMEDKNTPWDVSAADVKAATAYVAVPFMAVTPRMKMLEEKVAAEVGVKAYRNPVEAVARLGPAAKVWASPDPFCLTRALASFLPTEDGGTDATPVKELRLLDQVSRFGQVPSELYAPPPDIAAPELQAGLRTRFVVRFLEWVVDANPREKIHRGQFNEVIRGMIDREQKLNALRDRSRGAAVTEGDLAKWTQTANELYQSLSAARLPQNAGNLPAAQAALEQFWGQGGAVVQQIEDTTMVPVGLAEVGYFVAVCKHEQAERAGIRMHRTPPADKGRAEAERATKEAWAVAKDAWGRYLAAAEPYLKLNPERTAHARKLAERAGTLADKPTAAW
jgi:hypothetical protein